MKRKKDISCNVLILNLNTGDINKFLDLINLFEDVFEMENFSKPKSKHLQKLLTKVNFFVFVATQENK